MKVTRAQEKVIRQTLNGWRKEGVIDETEHQRLQKHIIVQPVDWQRLSRYAFWIALVCLIIAMGSLVEDEYLMRLLLNVDYLTRAAILAVFAAASYLWGFRRQKNRPDKRYSNEAILFIGVLFTALCLSQIGLALDNGEGNVAPLFLIGCLLYGVIAWLGRSGLVWLFCLLALGSYFGTFTGYSSGWGAYWLGMNIPLRFVLFGGVLLAASYLLKDALQKRYLLNTSKAMGLLYLFIALWILSIFGNDDFYHWDKTTQIKLLPWALLFALVAIACIWISLKTDDGMLRGFGLTFLGINLYTRYFELFWDNTNKVIFFLLLAVSLAFIGRYAEKIWRLGDAR